MLPRLLCLSPVIKEGRRGLGEVLSRIVTILKCWKQKGLQKKKELKELGLFRLKDRRSRSRITIIVKYIHSGVREEGDIPLNKIIFWGLSAFSVQTC